MRCFFLLLFSFFFLGSHSAFALDVKDIRFGKHPDKVRTVIELSDANSYKVFALQNPYRLVIDLPTFQWTAKHQNNLNKFGISALRSGQLDTQTSRIVFELDQPFKIQNVFSLSPNNNSAERLVIDFQTTSLPTFQAQQGEVFQSNFKNTAQEGSKTHKPVLTAVAPTLVPTTKPIPPSKPIAKPKPLVVIDPGHGGQDPGAVGYGGKKEKDIVLALSKELKKQLEQTGRYRVSLTRSNDRYIRLSNRVKIARDQGADLFLSIHADSINKPNISGASVYTLSEKASDAQTAKLAARENRSDIIAGVDLEVEDKEVANILVDLARRDTMNQSKFFAEKLVKNFKSQNIRTLQNPHRHAGFAVLKAPDVPSVLVEAGFISNRKEAELLSASTHRKRIARALKDGVDTYFKKVEQNNL